MKNNKKIYSQIANNIIPRYKTGTVVARPTVINAGTIKYSPKTAYFWVFSSGSRRTKDPWRRAIMTPAKIKREGSLNIIVPISSAAYLLRY